MKARFALIVVSFFAVAPAFGDTGRQVDLDWLQTIAFATHQTDYSGTFVYQRNGHMETARITHISDQNGEHEKLENLEGPRREFIRNNNEILWYLGDHKAVQVERQYSGKSFPALLPEQLSALNENYFIHTAEQARIAGFDTQAIVFQPKDTLRYAHKMWAHRDSGLLLKAVVLDERRQMVEQYTFIQLKIGGDIERTQVVMGQSTTTLQQQSHATPSEINTQTAMNDWKVVAVPSGFKKIMEMRRPLPGKKTDVLHFVFSDGLAGISVFIETLGNHFTRKLGLSSRGAIHVYSKEKGDYLVTVVGEVPPRTVMQVADSVRYKGQ
ncbi:MAG: sigma E regulatory protein, MucB/RseB [Candidatus Nitrotoga sp. CP45]|nr:MucB/RseB C-terminal domain-containing protein [Candidatus Nitrotoga sp.]RFC40873.1 MAG: sigma E regulatory protein, MucB/RseB [Candidatus Nitrotoga sp. CP45]